jgi:pre-mRNA-splicing factor SYF1
VSYLLQVGEWDEAAINLVKIVNSNDFRSTNNKSKHDHWMTLCDIVSKHSDHIKSIKVEAILRGGITKFSDQVGKLWTTLADYYIRLANYDKVRRIVCSLLNVRRQEISSKRE